jgi:hypothetical protein
MHNIEASARNCHFPAFRFDYNADHLRNGYPSWVSKKRESLSKLEREFLSLLQTETDASALAAAAEGIREAQILALKEKRAELRPKREAWNLDPEIRYWRELSTDSIIEGYRNQKLKGHRSREVRRAHSDL